jgi:sec-independent protein translocase protein TatC
MGDLQRILDLLAEVRHRLVRIAWVLAPIFAFLITFQLDPATLHVFGRAVPVLYPYPNLFNNVSAQLFVALKSYELPAGVSALPIGVGDAVVAQMEIAALVTLVLGMPWIIHEVGAFLVPALRLNERELLRRIGIPASILFAAGFCLGLFYLTPLTYRFLFFYVSAMQLPLYIGVPDFITFTLLYSIAFGIVFELPVFVYTLTRLGIVKASSWKQHWRGAIIGSLVFGMVITPDNSGITMLLIAAPMIALYFAGVAFASRWESEHGRPGWPAAVA